MGRGKVYLVGAGPGDPGLLTLRAVECLKSADLVIADRLVNPAILEHAPLTAEVMVRPLVREGHDQEEIERILIDRAQRGDRVVRLKGGDPFVFGRGGEEALALRAANVPFEVVPGVTAAVAAPAYAGIPLTQRGIASAVAFATAHDGTGKPDGGVDWSGLSSSASTLVLYMSVARLGEVVERLLASGRPADEPVAVIEWGTWPRQRTLVSTLAEVVEAARQMRIEPPSLAIVGEVVRLRERIAWFEERPLAGRRILLLSTQSEPRDVDLRGAELTRVAPLEVVPRFADMKQALRLLPEMRTVAFASVHAVDVFVSALRSLGEDARALAACKLAAVGEATARSLEVHGLRADLVGHAGGEKLAEEIQAAGFSGPFLLPRALGGREDLALRLEHFGHRVVPVDAYETVPHTAALARIVRSHLARRFSAIAFTSPKGVEVFLEAAGGAAALDEVLIAAIGETTARALAARGHPAKVVSAHPDLSLLLSELSSELAAVLAAHAKIE